jgi:dTDP-4-dehydrorhamnose reductase
MTLSRPAQGRTAWITGGGGFLGSYLQREAARWATGWTLVAWPRAELDLLEFAKVERLFHAAPPDLIIHCAALSRSGDCQADPARARRVNVDATGHLAGLAEGIPFVFFSSDLVFDGARGNYREDDPINPLSVYGETKAEAERVVLKNPRHTVVRTSLNAGISPTGGRTFTEEIKNAWRAGRCLRFFHDEFRCPLAAVVTARALWELIGAAQPGLYHLAGAERLSRLALGEQLARRWPDIRPLFEAASLKDYSGAPRPPDTSLNCARLQGLLSFPLPGFSAWLAAHPDEPI